MTERRPTVLVVEDEPVNLAVLSNALSREYRVVQAGNGTDGLEAALRERPDVAILDIQLPGIDGLELCRRMRQDERTRDVPVIFVTGMNRLDDEANALAIGGNDFLSKPISPARLRARVRTHMELKRNRDRLLAVESSSRRLAEDEVRKLSQAIEQSPNMVFITDRDGTIEYVNPRFTEITGYAADEAIGQNPRMLKSHSTPRQTHEALWAAVRAGGPWRGEIEDLRKDGTPFWAATTISPIRAPDGAITHFVAVQEDITERHEAERRATQAHLQAELAARAKTELMAGISHELRTPLNHIIGFATLIEAETFGPLGSPRYGEYLGDMRRSAEGLMALINDILDVAALDSGAMSLDESVLSAPEMVERAVRLVAPRAEQAGIALTIGALPTARLAADEQRVIQVLVNILANAIKFTPQGGSVAVAGAVNEDGGLALTVTDTGIGMDEQGIERALTRFRQVDGRLARRYEGAGLGLPLALDLMRLHGGGLQVTSRPGEGTVVSIRFPAERVG
ncbi:MAG: response regulator [Alphaproteobacteria bacterium]|nr:response regulator [Alphaproteobacteria bacterium]